MGAREHCSRSRGVRAPRTLGPAGIGGRGMSQQGLAGRRWGLPNHPVRLVSANGELTLHVQDDGRGFPVAAGHGVPSLGLTGMRERISALNGSVSLDSSEGAHVTVRIPLSRAS